MRACVDSITITEPIYSPHSDYPRSVSQTQGQALPEQQRPRLDVETARLHRRTIGVASHTRVPARAQRRFRERRDPSGRLLATGPRSPETVDRGTVCTGTWGASHPRRTSSACRGPTTAAPGHVCTGSRSSRTSSIAGPRTTSSGRASCGRCDRVSSSSPLAGPRTTSASSCLTPRFIWLPEALNLTDWDPGPPLAERSIDLLELGRQYEDYHRSVTDQLRPDLIHEFSGRTEEFLFPGPTGLRTGLAGAKLQVCFPKSVTHPVRGPGSMAGGVPGAGGLETVT